MQPRDSVQPAAPVPPDSVHLDALIARLKSEGESQLLIEHLQTASAYLQGAMTEECAHNLEMAQQMSSGVHTKSLQGEVKDTISELLKELHPPTAAHWKHRSGDSGSSSPTADGLREFFHGEESSLGLFYPKHHIVAVFRSFQEADAAREVLRAHGLHSSEVIAAPGFAVDEFLANMRRHRGLWSELALQISRLLDTEAGLVGRYVKWARRGAGFLAAYTPAEEQAEEVTALIRPLKPVTMHWFMPSFIRHLTDKF